jgi:universal stress protein F
MFKTIVVPVDPGHVARSSAMIAAARQLGGDDAKIVLMSVVEDIPTYVAAELPGGVTDKAKNNARTELERLAQENQLNAEIVVRSGQPSAGILGTAKEKQADVIVIASHKPDLSDYLLGSTAARVVRHAKCPVFVLR